MHELDRGGELDMAVAGIARELRHGDGEHRAQPLAAGRDEVIGHLRDHRHLRARTRQNGGVHALHVGATSATRLSIEACGPLSKGMTTAK